MSIGNGIIFDSPIQDTTLLEIDDISEQLNDRQKNAFSYAQKHGEIAKREYMKINQVSHRIAYEELKDMINKGLYCHRILLSSRWILYHNLVLGSGLNFRWQYNI